MLYPTAASFRQITSDLNIYSTNGLGNNQKNSHRKNTKGNKGNSSSSSSKGAGNNNARQTYVNQKLKVISERLSLMDYTERTIQKNDMMALNSNTTNITGFQGQDDYFYGFLDSTVNYTASCIISLLIVWLFGLWRTLYYSCHEDNNYEYITKTRQDAVYPIMLLLFSNAQVSNAFLGGTVSDVISEVREHTSWTLIVRVAIAIAVFWLLNSDPLMKLLGIYSIANALEEFAARVLIFNCIIYKVVNSEHIMFVAELMDRFIIMSKVLVAVVAGSVVGDFVVPVLETARTSACFMSGCCEYTYMQLERTEESSASSREQNNCPSTTPYINSPRKTSIDWQTKVARMCVILSGIIPILILDTYFCSRDTVRVWLAWLWVAVNIITARPLLQNFLSQSLLSSSVDLSVKEVTFETINRHFLNRHRSLVTAASEFLCTPLFVAMLLAFGHLGGYYGTFCEPTGECELSIDPNLHRAPTPVYDFIQSHVSSLVSISASAGANSSVICSPGDHTLHKMDATNAEPMLSWGFSFDNETSFWLEEQNTISTAQYIPSSLLDLFSRSQNGDDVSPTLSVFETVTINHDETVTPAHRTEESKDRRGVWWIFPAKRNTREQIEDVIRSNAIKGNGAIEISSILSVVFSHTFISPTIVYATVNFFGFLFCVLWIVCFAIAGCIFWCTADDEVANLEFHEKLVM